MNESNWLMWHYKLCLNCTCVETLNAVETPNASMPDNIFLLNSYYGNQNRPESYPGMGPYKTGQYFDPYEPKLSPKKKKLIRKALMLTILSSYPLEKIRLSQWQNMFDSKVAIWQ